MDRLTINYLLAQRGIRHQDIAIACKPPVARCTVTLVIGGHKNIPHVRETVAQFLNMKIEDIFPDGKRSKNALEKKAS